MIVAEVTIIPIGTGSSASRYVAEALRALEGLGLRYQLTPMSTVFEAEDLEEVFRAVKVMHEAVIRAGAPRVETILKIDDRRDKEIDMEYKIKSVLDKF